MLKLFILFSAQQANNGSLYNPMPVTKDNRFSNSSSHIQQDHEDLSVEQFAQKYAFPSDNFFEMQNSRDSQGKHRRQF